MSDIKIKEPFKIGIQILEFDEKQCSLKILLSYCVFFFYEKLIVKNQTSDMNNRFTTGLYLSEEKAGSVFEVTHYGGTTNRQLYEFTDVRIDNLLDLTDARTIGTQYEFTHAIAAWAKNNGYSGIKFPGTRGGSVEYKNFVIFEQSAVNNAVRGSINPINW